ICLHCPDPTTSTPDQVAAAVSFVAGRYAARTWIDHVWLQPDGTISGCREAYLWQGFDNRAAHYVGDILRQAGGRYFWDGFAEYLGVAAHCRLTDVELQVAVADLDPVSATAFYRDDVLARNNGFPTPRCWQAPWATGEAVAWPTYRAEDGSRARAEWAALFSKE